MYGYRPRNIDNLSKVHPEACFLGNFDTTKKIITINHYQECNYVAPMYKVPYQILHIILNVHHYSIIKNTLLPLSLDELEHLAELFKIPRAVKCRKVINLNTLNAELILLTMK